RLAQFLSQLSVEKSGAAFILRPSGAVIAAPDPDADETNMQRSDQPLLPIAQAAIKQADVADGNDKSARQVRLVAAGNAYAVTLPPLPFPGGTRAPVPRGADFLGPVETTIRLLLVGLAVFVAAAAILSAWLARRLLAKPLINVMEEVKHVERFELGQ